MFKSRITARGILTALALGGIILMAGCGGLSQSPLAPNRAAPSTAMTPAKASPRLALAGIFTRKDQGWFYPNQDGSLAVNFPPYGDNNTVRVEQATFSVMKGAISQEAYITMKVTTAALLRDVVFDFSPDGLSFIPMKEATLTVVLNGPVNAQHLKAYHISSTGQVNTVPLTVTPLGQNRWNVAIQVPGFSIYSLGDEIIPEGELP